MAKAKILVAEDEPLAGLEIRELLESMGHEVADVIDSADALLGAFLSFRPDLIIMDIRLKSFVSGIDAAARLRMLSSVPIIYLTGYPDLKDMAASTRPAAYLVKPLDELELRREVERALSTPGAYPASAR